MTTIIDRDRALELLREVVAERGEDFIYDPPKSDQGEGCAYAVTQYGKLIPSCAVGVAFAKLDPDLLTFAHGFDPSSERYTGLTVHALLDNLSMDPTLNARFEFTQGASRVLRRFQRDQDEQVTYGDALADAEAEAEVCADAGVA